MIKKIIGVSVVLVAVVYFMAPIIMGDNSPVVYPDREGWQYDDYKLTSAIDADGALELVESGNKKYLHAKDLGDGTITSNKGKTETVTVDKAELDVFFALGQSNNAYMSHDKTTASPVPMRGDAYYYGNSEAPTTGLYQPDDATMMPMSTLAGEANIGDKAPAFCAEYTQLTHHKVYYIIGAWSSSSIVGWVPDGQYWTAAKTILAGAIGSVNTDYYNLHFKGYTWIQGEANGSMTSSEYISKFLQMHDSILSGEMGYTFDHCFISKVVSEYSGPSNAQIQLALQNDTITLSTSLADTFSISNGLMASDGLHYTQAGDNEIGKALANSCAEWYAPDVEGMKTLSILAPLMISIIVVALILWIIRRNAD